MGVGGIAKYLLFLAGVGGGFGSSLRKKNKVNDLYFWWKICLALTICHIIRLSKCEYCTLTNQITLVLFLYFFFFQGFQKSYGIFGGGMLKYLLFLTGVGGWSGKDQKHPYIL